eukprot:4827003-Alexandrium_andersonii.AAC.1
MKLRRGGRGSAATAEAREVSSWKAQSRLPQPTSVMPLGRAAAALGAHTPGCRHCRAADARLR